MRLTTEEFVRRSNVIHKFKYDYTKTEYINSSKKVCIICPEHGEFWQLPTNHLHGYGCQECKKERLRKLRSHTTEEFIEKAKKVHGDKYDYSKVEYVNSSSKVKIICPKHGIFEIIPNDHLRGVGCSVCYGNKNKTNEEFIKEAKKVHGDKYDYSKVEYVNNKTKVCIICPKHGEFWQTPKNHLNGQGCIKCSYKLRAEKNQLTTEEFIEKARQIHGNKYDYSKVKYVNNKAKVCIICPEHGEFWQTANMHLQGNGCKICGGNKKKTIEEFIKEAREIHEDKYDYSKVEYVNAYTSVCIICPKHGEFWQTPNGHLKGSGCKKCGVEKRKLMRTYTLDEFINKSKETHTVQYDYSETVYNGSDKKVKIICPKHGPFWQIATDHLQGGCCPHCANRTSEAEKEINDFIENELGFETQQNVRNIIKGEIDIYIPSKKIGIEYDGLFWHSEKYKNDKNHHLSKTKFCEEKGIHLIHIFEDEWVFKKEIVKSMLRNILGKTERRIFARKCVIKEVSSKMSMDFLENNHLQGKCKAKYHYGLYYNDELVSLMTFGTTRQQRKYNKDYDKTFELIRFCNKSDTTVIGGASKLLKHFINNVQPNTIITYADKRWSTGNLYKQLNFKHVHDSKPNYFYIFGQKRENRFKYRKNELVKQGFDKNKSEHQIMLERGIYRIYDCGTIVFKMDLNKED